MAKTPQILHDQDRSAFGRGWELSRAGGEFNANPFIPGTTHYSMWAEGWLRYRDTLIGKDAKKLKLGRNPNAKGESKAG